MFCPSLIIKKEQFICNSSSDTFFLCRRIIPSSGPLDGTISSSPCLTLTFSGLGMEWFYFSIKPHEQLLELSHWCWCYWLILWHLCSIMNSLVIVLFLSGMVAMIMLRTLHKDIARYNQVDQVWFLSSVPGWNKLLIYFSLDLSKWLFCFCDLTQFFFLSHYDDETIGFQLNTWQ